MAKAPEDAMLLHLATAGRISHPRRALMLAEAGGIADAARLSLGARDLALMRLRAEWLGPRMPCVDLCASCGAQVGFSAPLTVLIQTPQDPPPAECGPRRPRRLTTADLLAVEQLPPGAARQALAEAVAGGPLSGPDEAVQLAGWLAQADPMAHVALDLACGACNARWSRPFDIVSAFWDELCAAGRRLLGEIHRLALAYHWSETQILALPCARRRAYLEMIGS